MILRKPTFKNKFSSDTKINFVYLNKNSSNQTLPNLVCNEFNKALITGISQISDLSTINSISNSIKDKHMKLKKKIGIYSEKYNSSDIDEIVENKNKAFEALENLVLNDEILDNSNNNSISNSNSEINITSNNNNTRIEESNYLKKNLNNFNSTNDTQNVNTFTSKKEKKCVSVPKLDFTSIYKKYNNSELNIKEVKHVNNSKKNKN
jgi:hypothetical protein